MNLYEIAAAISALIGIFCIYRAMRSEGAGDRRGTVKPALWGLPPRARDGDPWPPTSKKRESQ